MHCPPPHWGNVAALGGSGTDSDALLWKAAVVAAGGTVSDSRLSLVSTLIGSLKSAGVWTLLDRLFLLAAENSQSALIDLVALSAATAVNSPTFTTDQGYAGNASTSYVDTGFNPSTAALYSQASAHWGVWRRTAFSTGTNPSDGCTDNTFSKEESFVSLAGNYNGHIHEGGATPIFTGATGVGHHIASKTSLSAWALYTNGAGVNSGSGVAVAPVNANFCVGARSRTGAAVANFHNAQTLAVHLGAALSVAQALALYNALNTYKTAIGA
jgi:hypothetical protein